MIRLNSILQLHLELSKKLQISSLRKSQAEAEIKTMEAARVQIISEIGMLRQQRDLIGRRIEFCKQDPIVTISCSLKDYSTGEIRLATDDFSERLRLKSGGDWSNVYRGRINNTTVAIKMLNAISEEAFNATVKLLSNIRHPHFVAMIGLCSELKCIVFEYMHNGSLRDILLSSSPNLVGKNRVLNWNDRIRITLEICTSLSFLHSAEPRSIYHGHVSPSNVLLDRNLVAKIIGLDLKIAEEHEVLADTRALGVLMLQLLTGRNWAGLVEEALAVDGSGLVKVLEEHWPVGIAEEYAELAIKCSSSTDMTMKKVMEELDEIRRKAESVTENVGGAVVARDGRDSSSEIPNIFLCPIMQEEMKNPHVAADGFTYELEAIQQWLGTGHVTSPMTNLRLKHNFLTPNHGLCSLIQDWHSKNSFVEP